MKSMDISKIDFFQGLAASQLDLLQSIAEERQFKENDIIIEEGKPAHFIYIIKQGKAQVLRKDPVTGVSHVIAVLGENELLGEMSYAYSSLPSTSVIATEPVTTYQININPLKSDKKFAEINTIFLVTITKKIAERLRYTDEFIIDTMKKNILADQDQINSGLFVLGILVISCIYILMLKSFLAIKIFLTGTTPISTIVLSTYLLFIFYAIKKSDKALPFYGFTTKNWKKAIKEALFISLPIMAFLLLFKFIVITSFPGYQHLKLIDLNVGLNPDKPFLWSTFFATVIIYTAFCPVQEIIVRGGLQSSITHFITGSDTKKMWLAILASNTLFSMIHSHLSFAFSLLMFVPGILWGYMYHRHRTLIGVTLSHILLGVWGCFFVGLESIF